MPDSSFYTTTNRADYLNSNDSTDELYSSAAQYSSSQQPVNAYQRYSPSSDTYAEDVYSALIKDEYADYQNRFAPIQDQYIDEATSMEMLDEQLGRITANTKSGFDLADKAASMNLGRYGVTQSQEDQSKNNNQSSLNQSLATAQAKNSTRTHHSDRQMAMVTGSSLPDVRTEISSGASSSTPVAS